MRRMFCAALVTAVLALGCGEGPKETKPTVAPGTKVNPEWEKVLPTGGKASPGVKPEK
jgi:hypothetical protein